MFAAFIQYKLSEIRSTDDILMTYTVMFDMLHQVLDAARPYFVRFVNPLGYMSQSATVWMTVLLGVNRFLAICYPFRASRWLSLTSARIQV